MRVFFLTIIISLLIVIHPWLDWRCIIVVPSDCQVDLALAFCMIAPWSRAQMHLSDSLLVVSCGLTELYRLNVSY